jgi:hypothetical protein
MIENTTTESEAAILDWRKKRDCRPSWSCDIFEAKCVSFSSTYEYVWPGSSIRSLQLVVFFRPLHSSWTRLLRVSISILFQVLLLFRQIYQRQFFLVKTDFPSMPSLHSSNPYTLESVFLTPGIDKIQRHSDQVPH